MQLPTRRTPPQRIPYQMGRYRPQFVTPWGRGLMLPTRYPQLGTTVPGVPGASIDPAAPGASPVMPPGAAPMIDNKGPGGDWQRPVGTGPFDPNGPARPMPGQPTGYDLNPPRPGGAPPAMPPVSTNPVPAPDPLDNYPQRGGFGLMSRGMGRTAQSDPGSGSGGTRRQPPPPTFPNGNVINIPPGDIGATTPMPGSGTVTLPPSTAPLPRPTNPNTGPVVQGPVTGRGGAPLPNPNSGYGGRSPDERGGYSTQPTRPSGTPSSGGGSGSGSGNTNSAVDRWWDPGPSGPNISDFLPQGGGRSSGGGGGGGGGAPAGPDWRQIQFDEDVRRYNLSTDDAMLLALNRLGQEGYQFEDRLGFDYAGLDERARQYDTDFGQRQYEYDSTLDQRESEFGRTFGQGQYEFDTNMGQRRSEFDRDYGLRSDQQRFQQGMDQSAFEYRQQADAEQNKVAREGQSLAAFGRRIRPSYGF